MASGAQPYEGVKPRHVWVDAELLHWAAHPDPDMQGKTGSFNLECLKLYVTLCAEALRQAIRPKTSDALIAAQSDVEFLETLGFGDTKGVVALGILRRLGLIREAYTEKKHDASYTVAPPKPKNDHETEQQAREYTDWRMYEKFVEKFGDAEPEDFMKRYWSVRRCDGKPWNHNLPKVGVKGFVKLDWCLFAREGGRKTYEFMSLSPEEVFLLVLLHQGTRPYLTCSVHPTYIDRKPSGSILIGDIVQTMCAAAGFKIPVEDVLASLISQGYFAWVKLPLASQDAGKGGGGRAERVNTLTVIANYDARHPKNLLHPKRRENPTGTNEVIAPEELLESMQRVVLAPTRGFHVKDSEEILTVLHEGEIEVSAAEDASEGQALFGRFPIPRSPR